MRKYAKSLLSVCISRFWFMMFPHFLMFYWYQGMRQKRKMGIFTFPEKRLFLL